MKPFTRPSATKDKPPTVHKGAGEVRIIGGQWRRTKLPVANKSGLRPTPDRVRETLFNWLGQSLLGWKCADIFAGTGALGLEAASREASVVQLCEQDTVLVDQLKRILIVSKHLRCMFSEPTVFLGLPDKRLKVGMLFSSTRLLRANCFSLP